LAAGNFVTAAAVAVIDFGIAAADPAAAVDTG